MRGSSRSSKGSGAGFRPKSGSKGSRVFLFLFGMPFFAMGFFFCWIGAISPILNVISSGNWPQVPCVITTSEVKTNSGSDGNTYSVLIEFSYQYEGRDYTGGSYDFNDVSSSGYKGKAEIVRKYPLGSVASCWVNPEDPEEAVLSRRIPGIVFFIIPFISLFMVVGLGIMIGALGLFPKSWGDKFQSRHKPVEQRSEGSAELKPELGGKGKLIGMLFFCLFWNGIVSVFLWQVVEGFRKGNPEWFLTIFMIPFVTVGIGLIIGVFYYLLALFNPTISLRISEARPCLGQNVVADWKADRSLKRLKSLRILLEGIESATYRRGTDSVTDECVFYKSTLFETADPLAHRGGERNVEIPADMMHSFDGGNNEIKWRLRVEGDIPKWPDLEQDYPITVRPRELSNGN